MIRPGWEAVGQALVTREGPTTSVGLLRIGLVLVAWAEWARPLVPMTNLTAPRLAIGVSFFLSTLAMLLGVWSRAATIWAGLSMGVMSTYWAAVLGKTEFAHHHSYLIIVATFLLALTPCGASLSVNRWRKVRAAERSGQAVPPAQGNLWALPLIAVQLSAVYFWGAIHKLTNWGFVSGARLEQIAMFLYTGSRYPAIPGFHAGMALAACGTIALELALAFGLWWPRPRRFLMPAGIVFHLLIYYLVPVATFSATMCLLYLAYLPPRTVHETLRRLVASEEPFVKPSPDAGTSLP